jgi:hypothetical protein
MATPILIDIPIVVDASANVTVLASEIDISSANFIFDTISTSISSDNLSNSLFYQDNDAVGEESNIFTYDATNLEAFTAELSDALTASGAEADLTLVGSTDTQYTNTNGVYTGTLGEHYIQYVASKLFGHPLAQAPINNETDIRDQIHSADISGQVYAQIAADLGVTPPSPPGASANGLVLSIYETLVAAGRIPANPDNVISPFPFEAGDILRFIIRMQGGIESGGGTYTDPSGNYVTDLTNISNLFNYLIDPDYGTSTSVFSHRPLYKDGSNVLVKPKNWVVAMSMDGSPSPYFSIPTNQYTAAGTPFFFTVVGNKLTVDVSDTDRYFPPNVDSFVFNRDTDAGALSATDASYVSNVDGFDDDLNPYSETYILFAERTADVQEDVSAIQLDMSTTVLNLWNLTNTARTGQLDRLQLVPGVFYTPPNGKYTLLNGAVDAGVMDICNIYLYADVSGSGDATYVYSQGGTTDASTVYVDNNDEVDLSSNGDIHFDQFSGIDSFQPFYYIPDGTYDISSATGAINTAFDDVSDMEVSLNTLTLYNPDLVAINDPFELTYVDLSSNYQVATYSADYGATHYSVAFSTAVPEDISLSATIVDAVLATTASVETDASFALIA